MGQRIRVSVGACAGSFGVGPFPKTGSTPRTFEAFIENV